MRYNSQKSDMNMSFSIFFGKKFEKKNRNDLLIDSPKI